MRIVLRNCNLAAAERTLILVALAEMGDLEGAAELCGVSWARLARLLRAHAIEWPGAAVKRADSERHAGPNVTGRRLRSRRFTRRRR